MGKLLPIVFDHVCGVAITMLPGLLFFGFLIATSHRLVVTF
jgi:hypothetical protein